MRNFTENPLVRRFAACVFGGFVLCLMVGNQEGSQNDFGVSFRAATTPVRLTTFLLLGVAIFLVLTFWPLIKPYIHQPGSVTVLVGLVLSFGGMTLTRWYDPVGKFITVSRAVGKSHGVPPLVSFYFSPIAWVLLVIALVLGGAAVATRKPLLGYIELGYCVVLAIIIFIAHAQLVNFAKEGPDHTLGVFATCLGYLVFGVSGVIAARSDREAGDPMGSLERAMSWRPGLPMAGGAAVFGVLAFTVTTWFAPLEINAHFIKTGQDFKNHGLPAVVTSYLSWLGITLFVIGVIVAVLGAYRQSKPLSAGALLVGLVGLILTFYTLDKLTKVGARAVVADGADWQNLGAGGWLACLAFSLIIGCGGLAMFGSRFRQAPKAGVNAPAADPHSDSSAITRTVVPIAIAFALFYPPTLPQNWQNVVVAQIAAYLLLAVGLNVVVGWAGLLDLGYIAFYGIGSYTTAYFTSSLPVKPPHWLHLTPLLIIPLAIIACIIAGVLLGTPTLRLRGDYLAIVTLGFGEIIQILAINLDGITGGPVGPNVPHPALHINVDWGWLPTWLRPHLNVTWGIDNLPYWYLLLVLLGIVVFLFYRLEGSRLGRAWAAVREDEVAAQAMGIRTTRVKLMAFAIGASTSGMAGVFFASQIGYFDPTDFPVQFSILIVAYVVFGGMGSLQGAIAGAAALTWLPYFLQSQVPLPDSQMWIGALVIAMMIFRPAGLIPAKRRKAELAGLDRPSSSEVRAVPVAEGL